MTARGWLLLALSASVLASCGDPGRRESASVEPRPVSSPGQFAVTPSPIPRVKHGTLLKYLRVPDGVDGATSYRIMYSSRSVSGDPIVVTGLALVPDTHAAPNSRVVLTIGHGTTGLADECAPSVGVHHELRLLAPTAVTNDWVVAATDYEGLGTPGRHPYLVGVSEGRGVLDAAVAAAQLPRANAGNKVLIAGYSQGGHAALWANQVAGDWTPALDVLGTFAGAPASEIDLILQYGQARPIQQFVIAIVAGYAAAYPEAKPGDYLTDVGVSKLPEVDRGCMDHIAEVVRATPPDALVRTDGPADETWITLSRRNNPGRVAGRGPVLIVHSDQDELIDDSLSARARDRMCASGQVVERRVVQAGGHAQAVGAAYAAATAWFQQRVIGAPPVDDCAAPAG